MQNENFLSAAPLSDLLSSVPIPLNSVIVRADDCAAVGGLVVPGS